MIKINQNTDVSYYLAYPYIDWIIEQPISEKRFKNLLKAQNKTIFLNAIVQSMYVLLINYQEYNSISGKFNGHPSHNELNLKRSFIAAKISGLLSSCYSYTEHCKRLLHKIRQSPSFTVFENKYISCHEVLILQEVRNYAQHYGLPIHEISFSSSDEKFNVYVYLKLLKESKNKNLEILEKYPANLIDITRLLPLFIQQIYKMHLDIIFDLKKIVDSLYESINAAVQEMRENSKNNKLSHVQLVENRNGVLSKQLLSNTFQDTYNFYCEENKRIYEMFFDNA